MVKPGKCSRSDISGGNDARRGKNFSVYDFNPDDERVEKDSQKILSKFRRTIPKLCTSPVNKYSFLQCFMEGAKARDNYIEKEPLEIEDSDDERKEPLEIEVSDDESVCRLVSPVSWLGIPENESLCANPVIDHVNSALIFPGVRSCISESINSGGRGSGQVLANDQKLCVNSDDDQEKISCFPNEHHSPNFQDDSVIDVRSSSSSELGGHDEEEGSEHCSSAPFDTEAGVVVHPDLIIFRNMYFTGASLTFSRKFIKLESFKSLGTNLFALVWSISDIVKIKSFWCKKLETVTISLHLKSEVQEEPKTIKNVPDITELNFSVCDPRWCQIQDAIKSLDIVYKAAWNTVVRIDPLWSEFSPVQQKSGTFPEVCSSNCCIAFDDFVYPRGDPDAVSVSMKDVELLQPASFINDTIIDFYVKYLEQHLRPEEKHRFHFFNSFFFRKLADLDKDSSTACEGRSAFQTVFRWTRTVNIFEKDYLFIPVNFSLHWSLVVICHPGEVVKFTDEQMHESPKVPCILHMDSIRGSHRGLSKLFRRYLWEEWKERYKETSQSLSSNFLNLSYIMPELPQQENSYDCGLFVLHYLECFLERAPVHFSPYSSASIFLNKDWFPPAEASSRRGHVKNLVYRIGNSNARDDPLTTVDNYSSCYTTEGDTDKRCQLDTCHGRDSCGRNYSVKMFATSSPPRLCMGRLGRTHESDMVVVDGALGPGDSSRTLVDRICQQFCAAIIPINQMCNAMSPIEEEEATRDETPVESTAKGGSNKADVSFSRRILLPEINDVESSPESSPSCISPIKTTLNLHDEENHSAMEVLLVSDDDFDAYVVEDSLEVDDGSSVGAKENRTTPSSVANDNETCEQEVESPPYAVKAHVSESIASESEQGVMAKAKRLINRKGTLARYLSKDCK